MCAKINSNYLENYATNFTKTVCRNYFTTNKYMSGQGIIELTSSPQVNFFILKALFEAWQGELEKLKSNPYFDYRNNAVHEALRDFMNVLSKSIKIEKEDFEPLVTEAVAYSVILAVDPVGYYSGEIDKVPADQLNDYFKVNKKYFKWHATLITSLIDRAGLSHTHEAYKKALASNFDEQNAQLNSAESLLNSLNTIFPLDLDKLLDRSQPAKQGEIKSETIPERQTITAEADKEADLDQPERHEAEKKSSSESDSLINREEQIKEPTSAPAIHRAASGDKAIDPLEAWERFESREYKVMKGSIGKLSESVGINQRFMFTRELFDGNPDLLKHALKSVDNCESFEDAIRLLNERFVAELNWDKNTEAVDEFLQLVYRKFDQTM